MQKKVRWTEQDMNFGQISTIAITRKENSVSIRRHLAGVALACSKLKETLVFPLEPLLLLNQDLPRINRASPISACLKQLVPMLSILNPSQQEAFKRSHET
jgi:hypothetical protein